MHGTLQIHCTAVQNTYKCMKMQDDILVVSKAHTYLMCLIDFLQKMQFGWEKVEESVFQRHFQKELVGFFWCDPLQTAGAGAERSPSSRVTPGGSAELTQSFQFIISMSEISLSTLPLLVGSLDGHHVFTLLHRKLGDLDDMTIFLSWHNHKYNPTEVIQYETDLQRPKDALDKRSKSANVYFTVFLQQLSGSVH